MYNGLTKKDMIVNYQVLGEQYQDLHRRYRFLLWLTEKSLYGHQWAKDYLHLFIDEGGLPAQELDSLTKKWASGELQREIGKGG